MRSLLTVSPVTQIMDMHSGGGSKLAWEYIYIEAPEEEARVIFYNRFGKNPDHVTCHCCGSDYSLSESPNIYQATGYNRNCAYTSGVGYIEEQNYSDTPHQSLEEYLEQSHVLYIRAHEITEEDREGTVPDEPWGYDDFQDLDLD